jgi:LPXTG-site transpeptidase (sortase) family protein
MPKRFTATFYLSIVIVLSLLLGSEPQKVNAQTVWTEVDTPAEFNNIRTGLSGNYRLMADIDLSTYSNWTPIGTAGAPFTGRLDGNGKTVRNLTINNTAGNRQGLFGVVGASGKIENLSVKDANATAGDYAGLVTGVNNGEITKSEAEGVITGNENVGGLVGENNGLVSNCYSRTIVTGKKQVGGLVGSNAAPGVVATSYAAGQVTNSLLNTYLQFPGGADSPIGTNYIEIPHQAYYVTSSFTLEAWFQWDQTGSSDVDFIISKGVEQFEIHTGGASNGIRFIPISRQDTLWCDACFPKPTDGSSAYQDVGNVLNSGWNHVAAVWDFSTQTVKVYVNGVAQDIYQNGNNKGTTATIGLRTPGVNPLAANTNSFYIGKRRDNWFPFAGKIADVRFWNIVRTADQIEADKYKQLTGSETGLMGYWKLDEASGTTAFDSTSNHNNGTIFGATRVTEVTANFGGLVGLSTGTVTGSFYDETLAGQSDTGKGDKKNTGEMKTPGTFTGWNTTDTWKITSGAYPVFLSYTLTYTAGANGSITGTGTQVVSHGGTGAAVTAVANGGYEFVKWSDDVTTAARTDSNVTGDLTVTASFAVPDTTPPSVLPATLSATISAGATSVGIGFNEDLKNDGSSGAANNPANYKLFSIGANGAFDTVNCAGGVLPDDVNISVGPANYDPATKQVTLTFNNGAPLPAGNYRLLLCGTTSLEDLAGNKLNNGLADTAHDFTVFAGTTGGVSSGAILPASGFPMGRKTILPAQPVDSAYSSTEMILIIPGLNVRAPIVGVPLIADRWEVSWLGNQASHLYGSAAPTLEGNTVITGHVWTADDTPGIFAQLKTLKYGDRFQISAFGKTYSYEVRENNLVGPKDVKTVFKREKLNWVTLLTCEGYDPDGGGYQSRRAVRAVLLKVD